MRKTQFSALSRRCLILLSVLFLSGIDSTLLHAQEDLFDSTRNKTIVNMYSGKANSGAGDVAANFLMAQQLYRAFNLSWDIHFWVSTEPEERRIIEKLFPFIDFKKAIQVHNGITYYLDLPGTQDGRISRPSADYFIAYSLVPNTSEDSSRLDLKRISRIAKAKHHLVFYRYDGIENNAIRSIHDLNAWPNPDRALIFDMGGKGAGFYVSPQHLELETQENLSQIYQEIRKNLGSRLRLEERGIVYAYAHNQNAHLTHAEVIARLASKQPKKKFLYFTNYRSKLRFPRNVKVIRYKSTTLRVARHLIALSELPVLVTGDVSTSLAIQYRKPFLSEYNTWREKSTSQLASIYTFLVNPLVTEKRPQLFQELFQLGLLNSSETDAMIKEFIRLWEIPPPRAKSGSFLQSAFEHASNLLKSQRSLVTYTASIVSLLEEKETQKQTPEQITERLQAEELDFRGRLLESCENSF